MDPSCFFFQQKSLGWSRDLGLEPLGSAKVPCHYAWSLWHPWRGIYESVRVGKEGMTKGDLLLGRGFKVFYSYVFCFFTFLLQKFGEMDPIWQAYVSHPWEKTPTRYVSITFKKVLLFVSIEMSMDKVFVLPVLLISSGSFHLKSWYGESGIRFKTTLAQVGQH